MNGDTWIFLALCGALLVFLLAASFLSKNYSLDRIKSKTVGDGQHGTARWATPKEIGKTYHTVPFRPRRWRKGKELPTEQGLILGSVGGGKRKSKGGSLLKISRKLLEKLRRPVAGKQKRKPKKKSKVLSKVKKMIEEQGDIRALVDSDDVHCLMIGASGVGKTAFFLYPNLEYACACGMSFLALDTKGDLARNYGAIASRYYGYRVSVIDLRNPTRSDGFNFLTLMNHYMDIARKHPENLAARARAEKYAKILAKTIINPDGDAAQYGENAFFYDSAEGLLTAIVLLLAEFAPPKDGEPEKRHIVSAFKLVQDLLAVPKSRGKNGFQLLMDELPPEHKARWLAGAALTSADQSMASVMSTVMSRLNAFLDTELEQVICYDSPINAEMFASEKCAIFLILPEEDPAKNFIAGLMIQNLSRELFSVADEHDGRLKNRVVLFCDELGMLYIDDRTGGRGKMPELIRYDQIASYEEYLDETPAKEPGQEPTLNGGGLKLKLVQPRSITEAQTQRGMRPHPYIKQELVICFSKRDRREIGYAHIARQHLDHIFGVHDNETSMFGFRMSKAEERELKGQMGMIGAMGAVASAAMKGGQLSEQEKARFVENINLANDAQTGGMAVYSRRADEAFAKVQ